MSLLKWLTSVSPFRGMPIEQKTLAALVYRQTGEVTQFYYNASGTLTADAGQAAGVVVMANFVFSNLKNPLGDMEAKKGDTSLTFTSTAATNERGLEYGLDPSFVTGLDECAWPTRLAAIGAKLKANGDYYVDYTNGVIYIKKASTQSTLTAVAYNYQMPAGSNIEASRKFVAVSPSDTVALTYNSVAMSTKGIYVGGAGNIAIKNDLGAAITFTGVLAGVVYPISATLIMNTNTTASNMVALF